MNWVDLIIVLVTGVYALTGWRRGFILGLLDLVGLAVSLVVALLIFGYVSGALSGPSSRPGLGNLLTFAIAFFLVDLLFWLLARKAWKALPESVRRSRANRWLGVALGAAKGLFVCVLVILVVTRLPVGFDNTEIEESALGSPLLRAGSTIERVVTSAIPEKTRRGLAFITIIPREGESVRIPATRDVSLDTESEVGMLRLVNRERTSRGLVALSMDRELRDAARRHARDMFAQGYFAHDSLDGRSPFDRLRDSGASFGLAGENLAMAPTLSIAHQGLMNSPGHRANILRPGFRRAGIGVYFSPRYGRVYVQEFAD